MSYSKACFIFDSLMDSRTAMDAFLHMVKDVTGKLPAIDEPEIHIILPVTMVEQLYFDGIRTEPYKIHSILAGTEGDMPIFYYCEEVLTRIRRIAPDYIYMVSSTLGRTMTSWLATSLDTGVIADAIDLEYDACSGHMVYTRSTNNDTLLSTITFVSFPEVASIRPSGIAAIERDNSGLTQRINHAVYHPDKSELEKIFILSRTRIEQPRFNGRIIVGVGRGVSGHALNSIRKFTGQMNIPLLCTKPLVGKDEFTQEKQIGQSGSSIQADLYIAVGISGATQHMIGTLNCQRIIAVNNDPKARIHQYSDISLVNDAESVFASLLEML
ncbi:Electron transfer flavoprotein subunit alpha [compost metagenome]